MDPKVESCLVRTTVRVLEDRYSLVPIPEDPPEAEPREPCQVRVDFRGPFCGTVVLRAGRAVTRALAASLPGSDDGSEQRHRDALGEVANVVCADLLPALAGRVDVFLMDAPRGVRSAPSEETVARVRLHFDEGDVEVLLFTDERGRDLLAGGLR